MSGYSIELTPDENGTFLVTCPALPEVTTWAESKDEAADVALNAIEEAIAARLARNEDVPPWSDFARAGSIHVSLPLQTALKVSLQRAMISKGLSRAELARRLGWHREQVDRLFRIGHASRLDQLEAAFDALGLRLDHSVVDHAA